MAPSGLHSAPPGRQDAIETTEKPPDRVQAICRVRPSEDYGESCVSITPGDGGDILTLGESTRGFSATRAFGQESTQEDVFDCVGRPSLQYVLRGFGACIFAYGQTGSGKTYSMTGTQASPGLIPRMIRGLFNGLVRDYGDFTVTCRYVEVYMEKVRDLFNPTRAKNPWDAPGPKLNVRYDGKRVLVENAKCLSFGNDPSLRKAAKDDEEFVETLSEKLLSDVENAGRHRAVRGHALNAESSRSHALLTLDVTARRRGGEVASSLMLVDLAGCENIGKAQPEGFGIEEAKSINKSLFALTRCIEALSLGQKVPFRDSVLTKLLLPALDGRCCCTLIAALNGDHITETRETLKFMETAVKVAVRPKQTSSEALGAVQEQARDLHAEIEALRQELEFLRKSGDNSSALRSMVDEKEELLRTKMELLAELQRDVRDIEEQLAAVQRELNASKSEVEQERGKRLRAEAENSFLQAQLQDVQTRNIAEKQMQSLRAQKQFTERKDRLITELGAARTRHCFGDAMRIFIRMVRLLHEDLEASTTDHSHHAVLGLLEDFRVLADSFESCLQTWPELQAGLSDLLYVARELDVQSRRMQSLCKSCSGIANADMSQYQAALEEVWRLSQSASTMVLGVDLPSIPSTSVPKRTVGLQALLQSSISLFSKSLRQWRSYKLLWRQHWDSKLNVQAEDGGLNGQFELGNSVAVVADELDSLFITFRDCVGEILDHQDSKASEKCGTAACYALSFFGVQETCLEFLDLRAFLGGDQELASKELSEEFQGTALAIKEEGHVASFRNMLGDLDNQWQLLNSSAQGSPDLRQQVEGALRGLNIQRLCGEDSFQRCLLRPSAAFIRDVIKFLHYGSALFKDFSVEGLDWNDNWSAEHPVLGVKLRFLASVCDIVSAACGHRGWSFDTDPKTMFQAFAEEERSEQTLRFLAQLSIVVNLAEIEQASVANGLLSNAILLGERTEAFCSWVCSLRARMLQMAACRRQEIEQQLANSEHGVEALKDTVASLRAEREQHLEEQRRWEAERGSLQQDLHQAQGENKQLMIKIEGAAQDRDHDLQTQGSALQEQRDEVDFWRARAEDSGERMAAMEVELAAASARQAMRPEDSEMLNKQLAVTAMLLSMVAEVQDSLVVTEGGQEVQDVLACLKSVLQTQLDTLKKLVGDSHGKAGFDLMMAADFISKKRANRKLREAKNWAQGQTPAGDGPPKDAQSSADAYIDPNIDEASSDLCERLHMVLLALAEEHASVGAVRLEEERALVAYMRASLKKAWSRRHELGKEVAQLQAASSFDHVSRPLALQKSESPIVVDWWLQLLSPELARDAATYTTLAAAMRSAKQQEPELLDLEPSQPEFCKLRALVEGTGSRSLTLSVRRIRKVRNLRLEADFCEGIAGMLQAGGLEAEPLVIRSTFHGTSLRLCKHISEEGFRLPRDLGIKLGPHGNAVHLANCVTSANSHCTPCPGRIRSLLICDIVPGRTLSLCAGESAPLGGVSGLGLEEIRSLSRPDGGFGYDSLFIGGHGTAAAQDLYVVYDPRLVMPRYVVDFGIDGLGSEEFLQDSEEAARLKDEVTKLREQGSNVQVAALRTKLQLLAEVVQEGGGDSMLVKVERRHEPELWDKCADRVMQATADGSGLAPGLEAVMTRLELVVNPSLASRFYACAAELLYPEEPFQWLLHGASGANVHQVVDHGFKASLPDDGRTPDQLYGQGVYFATDASCFLGCSPGSHKLFLCEVALGRSMVAQSARPNLDADSLQRAGFDSLRVAGSGQGEAEECIVYNVDQALPVYLLSYDVQPKALASELLREVVSLEERRKLLDEQMAALLQELEEARGTAQQTSMKLDEQLARQMVDEEKYLFKTRHESQVQQECLDSERANQLHELERAKLEVRELRARQPSPAVDVEQRSPAMEGAQQEGSRREPPAAETPPPSRGAPPPSGLSKHFSLPSLRGRK